MKEGKRREQGLRAEEAPELAGFTIQPYILPSKYPHCCEGSEKGEVTHRHHLMGLVIFRSLFN